MARLLEEICAAGFNPRTYSLGRYPLLSDKRHHGGKC